MAWIAVDKNKTVYIYEYKPFREDGYWLSGSPFVEISKQTMKAIIGRDLTWNDEAVEIK